eukprot:365443-Chlamydomonas_euryale.AAC.29
MALPPADGASVEHLLAARPSVAVAASASTTVPLSVAASAFASVLRDAELGRHVWRDAGCDAGRRSSAGFDAVRLDGLACTAEAEDPACDGAANVAAAASSVAASSTDACREPGSCAALAPADAGRDAAATPLLATDAACDVARDPAADVAWGAAFAATDADAPHADASPAVVARLLSLSLPPQWPMWPLPDAFRMGPAAVAIDSAATDATERVTDCACVRAWGPGSGPRPPCSSASGGTSPVATKAWLGVRLAVGSWAADPRGGCCCCCCCVWVHVDSANTSRNGTVQSLPSWSPLPSAAPEVRSPALASCPRPSAGITEATFRLMACSCATASPPHVPVSPSAPGATTASSSLSRRTSQYSCAATSATASMSSAYVAPRASNSAASIPFSFLTAALRPASRSRRRTGRAGGGSGALRSAPGSADSCADSTFRCTRRKCSTSTARSAGGQAACARASNCFSDSPGASGASRASAPACASSWLCAPRSAASVSPTREVDIDTAAGSLPRGTL